MKCKLCDSETPPLYHHHSLLAVICHTCKSLGRAITGLVVESQPPTPEIEQPQAVEPDPQPAEAPDTAAQIEEPAPASGAQIVDQEQDVATEAENEDPTPTTPPRAMRKIAKLKL